MNNDLISREYIKLFVCEYEKFNGKETEIVKAVPIQAIDNAPAVDSRDKACDDCQYFDKPTTLEPCRHCTFAYKSCFKEKAKDKRQTGEWVVDEFGRKICGKCQFPFAEFQSDNYCSLCGADMRKGEEEC